MSIKDDFVSYQDGNKLMAPNPVPPGTIRGSDNGPYFLSEYYIMLERNGEATPADDQAYMASISSCVGSDGHLHRAPGDASQDEIDDHLGVLAGYAELMAEVPFTLPFALYRFPQLVYAYLVNKGWSPILLAPLGLVTAVILAASCIGADILDADSRRLNWALWQATKRHSFLCNLAGKFWHWRQVKIYGPHVMAIVASIYYRPQGINNNPYSKYWID